MEKIAKRSGISQQCQSFYVASKFNACVVFLMFCFRAVCFFINVSFRAAEVLFEPFCPVDTVRLFTVFTVLYLC